MTRTPESERLAKASLPRLVRPLSAEESTSPVANNDRRSMTKLVKQALYRQVYDFLARRIAIGAWKPGAILPNEQELARELGVSPGTMRKALEKLEADQIVVRRQGKGTFVVDRTGKGPATRFSNIANAQGERMGVTENTTVAHEIGIATGVERARLDVRDGEKVVRTRRVFGHQGRPYLYEETCLAIGRLAGLHAEDIAGGYLIAPLAQQCGIQLARAIEKITVAEAPSEVGKLLAVPPGSMLLTLDRLVFSLDNQPLEWRMAMCNLRDECYLVEMI